MERLAFLQLVFGLQQGRELAALVLLALETIQVADEFARNSGVLYPVRLGLRSFLLPNLLQFAGIEPVPGAVRTLIDLHPAFAAEEVTVKLHPGASGTFPLPALVDDDALIASDFQQAVSGLVLLIHTLQFERIEPNAATPALTNIYGDVPRLKL